MIFLELMRMNAVEAGGRVSSKVAGFGERNIDRRGKGRCNCDRTSEPG
ncbi:MAG: hypothetical protein JGK17_14760 [Microcoleus sp. PH2017_10_PVI_O_A]|nr:MULTISPECIES: hypothetical protein [unclassified Microcoleus]MCC3406821.1 hypothetical protein [Microcoleus sp. PH2017_10_PVI_O_A]MCC3460956.1 hypothetical protein [Microcoleus sp. PH2017_11_PCY_U_A]MCC3560320.1 hypothetical protein [Microcoleus sp. PH2017_27_LUM_O_A]